MRLAYGANMPKIINNTLKTGISSNCQPNRKIVSITNLDVKIPNKPAIKKMET